MSNKRNIFSTSDCLSFDTLTKYQNDLLPLKERHRVEKHMLECELCMEAMEGFSLLDKRDKDSGIIFELNKRIKIKYNSDSTFDIRKVAAGVAAIIVLASGLFYLNYNKTVDTPIAVKKDNQNKLSPEIKSSPQNVFPESPISINSKPKSIEHNKEKVDEIVNNPGEVSSDAYIIENHQSPIPPLSEGAKTLSKEIISSSSVKEEEVMEKQDEKLINPGMAPVERRINSEPEDVQLESREEISKEKSARPKKSKEIAHSASKLADVDLDGSLYKGEVNSTSLESGVLKYEEKKYKEAILLFETLIKLDSLNDKALYYNGLSYFDSGFLEKAMENFGRIKLGMDYFEDARWKRVLVLISQGDKNSAKKLLVEISSGNGIYKNKAKEELKKLE